MKAVDSVILTLKALKVFVPFQHQQEFPLEVPAWYWDNFFPLKTTMPFNSSCLKCTASNCLKFTAILIFKNFRKTTHFTEPSGNGSMATMGEKKMLFIAVKST